LTGTRIETVPGPRDHSADTPRLWGKGNKPAAADDVALVGHLDAG